MENDFQIYNEDWMSALAKIVPKSVQCCVTSPPYWGLRDYGVAGQLGLEKTPEEYIGKLVAGFSLLRNALADDGILWLNLGDSYVSGKSRYSSVEQTISGKSRGEPMDGNRPDLRNHEYLKDKDLAMIPARVAIELQRDGWYLRSEIVWQKPNPMPESVEDRPTKSHEMIYLLTKNAKYYYDAEAIQEPYAEVTLPRQLRGVSEGNKWKDGADGQTRHTMNQPRENLNHSFYKYTGTAQKDYSSAIAQDPSETKRRILESMKTKGGANKKDVWTINTANCPEAHFATFPEEIPRLCIAAGSKKGQIILDPFAGSGTTGEVALRMERKFIGIELNETYTRELIKPRLNSVMPLFQKL